MNKIKKLYNVILFILEIWVIILALVVLSEMVFATTFNYTINYSKLPFETTKDVILTGKTGLSVNISYDYFMYGAVQKNFISNKTNLLIYINVPDNITIQNYTQQIRIIGSLNNKSYNTNITFDFYIYDDRIKPDVEYIQIDINEFEYIICDYSLPYNITKKIVVNGVYNQIIQTAYNKKFFTLPDVFTIPIENYTIINIKIHLDENLTLQRYTEKIRFNIVSKFANITFHFDIIDCAMPITLCNELGDIMNEVCLKINKTPSEILDCRKRTLEYDTCIYNAMLDASQKITVQNITVQYVNFTEYKDILTDDPNVISIMRDMILTWKQLKSDVNALKTKDKQISKLEQDLNKVWKEANKRQTESLSGLLDENKLKQNTIDDYQKKYMKKSTIYWLIFFWLPVIGGLVWLYFAVKNNYVYY